MTIKEAFILVANLDFKESHRRYAPQHSLVQFNRDGEVVSVYRFKSTPREIEQSEALSKHPGCLQISATPNSYLSEKELQEKINDGLWIFKHMKDVEK